MSRLPPLRIALVEDHAGTRAALSSSLSRTPERMVLTGAYRDAETLLAVIHAVPVSVVLIDLNLPGMSGAELIIALRRSAPHVRCIALTCLDDEAAVQGAIRAGAYGYLLKDEPTGRLLDAVEEAARGAYPVSSRVAGFLFMQVARSREPVELSPREEQLAEALAQGMSYGECSQRMGVAVGTVQEYVKRLYRKLSVSSKREVREWVALYGAGSTRADKRSPPA